MSEGGGLKIDVERSSEGLWVKIFVLFYRSLLHDIKSDTIVEVSVMGASNALSAKAREKVETNSLLDPELQREEVWLG